MNRSESHLTYKELVRMIRTLNDEITYLKSENSRLESRVEFVARERDKYSNLYEEMKDIKESRYDPLVKSLSELLTAQKKADIDDLPF